MKKKVLSIILTICIVFSMLPVTVMAAGAPTVVSDFTALQNAINAASGDMEFQLASDYTSSGNNVGTLSIATGNNYNFTIDLNGQTMTTSSASTIIHSGSGTLRIKSTEAGGKVTCPTAYYAIHQSGPNSNMIIESGTISNTGSGNAIILAAYNAVCNLTVLDGEIKASGTNSYAITLHSSINGGTVNISGGTINSTSAYAIYDNSTAATINISGGTISGLGTKTAIYSYGNSVINITGGTINSINNTAITIINGVLKIPSGTPIIQGGTQAMNVAPVLTGYRCTVTASANYDGSSPTTYNSGSIASYKYLTFTALPPIDSQNVSNLSDLQTIVNNATGNLDLKLASGYTGIGSLIIPNNNHDYTIDLNGQTMDGGTGDTNYAINHLGTGTLTIKDTAVGGGKVTCNTIATTSTICKSSTGNVNISGGTVSNTGEGNTISNNSSGDVIISGGTLTSNSISGTIRNNGIGNLIVSGGVVSSTDNEAICNAGTGNVTISGGTLSSINGKCVNNTNTGSVTIDGGTISTNGNGVTAIYNYSTGNVTITGGTISAPNGIGVGQVDTTNIFIPSGSPIIQGNTKAMNLAPILTGYTGVLVTASTNYDGSSPETYNIANIASYKYLKFETGTSTPLTSVSIGGTAQVGQTVVANVTASGTPTATYEWQLSSDGSSNWSAIPSAISNSLTLTANEYNKYIRVIATGTGSYSGTVTSVSKGPVIPAEITQVSINGIAGVGETITATPHAVGPAPAVTPTAIYSWESSSDGGSTWATIPSATSNSYTLTLNEFNKLVRVSATGTGAYTGTASYTTSNIAAAQLTSDNISVSGTAQVGSALTATTSPAGITVSYQWYCNTSNSNTTGTAISGATFASYTPVSGDVGKYLFFVVTSSTGTYQGDAVSSVMGAVTAAPVLPSSGSGSGGSSGTIVTTPTVQPIAEINGKTTVEGTIKTDTTVNGITATSIVVDSTSLSSALNSAGTNSTVTVPFTEMSQIMNAQFNGQDVKNMEGKSSTLIIETPTSSYILPAIQINIDAVSDQLGASVTLSDIKVDIAISRATDAQKQIVISSVGKKNAANITDPMNFNIKCTYDGKTIDVSKFNAYVERIIQIPDGVDPKKITTGVILDSDGTVRHTPTVITKIDDKYYAKINSLTNSLYSVVWHPIEFPDVASHWAKQAINNMGSRMVVSGTPNGNFEPDRNITRAEFAEIMVNGLGLKPVKNISSFKDVNTTDRYAPYIETAYQYQITAGVGNNNFAPNAFITRQDAMTMIARAMKIIGLTANTNTDTLTKYTDNAKISAYAKEAIAICINSGIVSGRPKKTLAPNASITRAEVTKVVEGLLQKANLIND